MPQACFLTYPSGHLLTRVLSYHHLQSKLWTDGLVHFTAALWRHLTGGQLSGLAAEPLLVLYMLPLVNK